MDEPLQRARRILPEAVACASIDALFESEEPLLNPPDTDNSTDVYGRSDAPYGHPVGASPFRVPMVPAYQACETPGSY